jgi:hypothetical protein
MECKVFNKNDKKVYDAYLMMARMAENSLYFVVRFVNEVEIILFGYVKLILCIFIKACLRVILRYLILSIFIFVYDFFVHGFSLFNFFNNFFNNKCDF